MNLFNSGGSILKVQSLTLFISITYLVSWCNGANVLFFFGLSTYSHRITAWPLAAQLAEAGHSVTFLQPVVNKNPHPKIIDMNPSGMTHRPPENLVELRLKYGRLIPYAITYMLPTLGVDMCYEFLNNSKNVEWVNSKKFDLVVLDALSNDCGYGLAYKWNAKTVVFGTTHVFEWHPDSFGFSDESWWIPGVHFAQEIPLGFLGRLQNVMVPLMAYLHREFNGLPYLDRMLRDKLKMPEMPSVSLLLRNTSLIFLNTHFSEELARSLPPSVVPIGGMHVSDVVKALPKDMEDFIKGSGNNGFIYMSFGSEADMALAPEHIRKIFFDAIGKAKTRFLWRWNGDRPAEMPTNVLTAKWMPQQDLLGHPKIKGFITHGGLLSMQEAVKHAVPMIAFPIFAEQDYNAERLHRTGRGIRLDIKTLTEQELAHAIQRLLTDSGLKQEMKLASERFMDRPAKPVDTAVWWVNYILRHKDTSFLRPLAVNLTWYERRQLDVWAAIFITSLISFYIGIKLCKCVCGLCCGKSKTQKNPVTKTKKKN